METTRRNASVVVELCFDHSGELSALDTGNTQANTTKDKPCTTRSPKLQKKVNKTEGSENRWKLTRLLQLRTIGGRGLAVRLARSPCTRNNTHLVLRRQQSSNPGTLL